MTDETEDQRWQRLSQDRVDRPLPKRFYQNVTVADDNAILLDGRSVKTPLKAKLQLPSQALAYAVAAEWEAQVSLINPALMPLTKLANTAIDKGEKDRAAIIAELGNFAANDLVCYRTDAPAELAAMQASLWDPVTAWAQNAFPPGFKTTQTIIHVAQNRQSLAAVKQALENYDAFHLVLAHSFTTLTGSALISLMLLSGVITPEGAWAAAHVDEDFQVSQWGEDFEAAQRRRNRKAEFDAAVSFFALLAQGAASPR